MYHGLHRVRIIWRVLISRQIPEISAIVIDIILGAGGGAGFVIGGFTNGTTRRTVGRQRGVNELLRKWWSRHIRRQRGWRWSFRVVDRDVRVQRRVLRGPGASES